MVKKKRPGRVPQKQKSRLKPAFARVIKVAKSGGHQLEPKHRLAEAIGVSRQTMNYWVKRGYAAPEYYKRMAQFTQDDVTVLDLLDDLPTPT